MLQNFTLQTSKRNSQLLLQILQDKSEDEETNAPSAFDESTDFDGMTDDEIKALVEAQQQAQTQTTALTRFAAANAEYQVMPEGARAELLEQKNPNPNSQAFIDWLAVRSFSPFGLSEQFATGRVSGADLKANQIFSERCFREHQKQLERFCDFTFRKWAAWAHRRGMIEDLSEEQLASISWSWPRQEALDEVQNQNAIKMQLENLTASYQDILGNDYQSKLTKIKDELSWCKANGIPHPAFKLISGGESVFAEKANETEGA